MVKGKNGFMLAEETLKIILAVIVIGFLIYFLVSLYLSNKTSEELEFAKASLDYVVEQLNSKNPGIMILNPNGWMITSWKKGNMPLQCSNLGWENCVCICDRAFDYFGLLKNTPLEDCNEQSVCLEYNKEITIKDGVIVIEDSSTSLKVNYGNTIGIEKNGP